MQGPLPLFEQSPRAHWRERAGARVWSPLPLGYGQDLARDESSGGPHAGRSSAGFSGLVGGARVLSPAPPEGGPGSGLDIGLLR